jgi:hypothetical protein
MKKNFIVRDNEGEHEYDISVEKIDGVTKTTLSRSTGFMWTKSHKGEEIISMSDNGDEITFNKKIDKTLNYEELSQLRLLLNFENKTDTELNQDNYKIIEDKDSIII